MIVIGHVALIQRTKKQDFVLKVVAGLKAKGHQVVGLFPGECREPDFKEELEKLIGELGLEKDVMFFGRRNDIPDLLKTMDVLMIPSSFEGFPLAGLEAASAGVPVVACNVAGAKEFVDVSGGGMTFAEDDVAEAIKAVEYCVENKPQIVESGKHFADRCALGAYKGSMSKAFVNIH